MIKKLIIALVVLGSLMGMTCFITHFVIDAVLKEQTVREQVVIERCEQWKADGILTPEKEKACANR